MGEIVPDGVPCVCSQKQLVEMLLYLAVRNRIIYVGGESEEQILAKIKIVLICGRGCELE